VSPDPAASYRHRTERQRSHAENRFSREAAETLFRYQAEKDATARAAYPERQRGLLAAAKSVLAKGSLKGEPLTPAKRREVEDIARRARRAQG
jgi:hypothetical protein